MTAKQISAILDSTASRIGGVDLINETVLSFTDLARRLPSRRNNRPTHVGTIHRWRLRGVKGVKLAAARLGGTWVTSLEAYTRFCDALTRLAGPSDEMPASSIPSDCSRTEQLLDDFGV